jgi:hypothetical protein
MSQRLLLAVLLAAVTSSGALAQNSAPFTGFPGFSGTPEEQNACRRDVVRYCKNVPPDEMLVLNCLRRERQRISQGCLHVLETHGQ